jgi:MoxR-like ATPase
MEKDLVEAAILRFYGVRKVDALKKKPSTSELLDWLVVLAAAGADAEEIANRMPFLGTLIKKEQDMETMIQAMRRGKGVR